MESILLFVLMAVVLALVLNVDINYGCGSCSKSQGIVLRFAIFPGLLKSRTLESIFILNI